MSDRSPDESLSTEDSLLEFIESDEDEPQPEWEFNCNFSDSEEDYDWASEEEPLH
jgi:hypothetical protein